MYLKKLELAGFKSFGGRTSIVLEPGLTAVVGPNGSGKSNVADAVRWVLGEQSMKTLRLSKSEEVIFTGTESKTRASMAEVSLLLDNEDSAMPVDAAEVQITRRLYRSGASEYLLNGNKVQHGVLQQLLAQAGFGQNSYAVIGQGMIDRLLLATPLERKTLFEEASGTKKYELKRDDQMRKLDATQKNITRLTALLAELAPRYKEVAAEAELLERQQELTRQLAETKRSFARQQYTELLKDVEANKQQHESLQGQLAKVEAELRDFQTLRSSHQAQLRQSERSRTLALKKHTQLTLRRTKLVQKLADLEAQLHILGQTAKVDVGQDMRRLQRDRKVCLGSLAGIRKKITSLAETIDGYNVKLGDIESGLKQLNASLAAYRKQLQRGQKREYLNHALGLLNLLAHKDNLLTMSKPDRDLAVHKMRRMIMLAIEDQSDLVAQEMTSLQAKITRQMSKREEQIELRNKEIIRQRGLEIDCAAHEEALKQIDTKLGQLRNSGKDVQPEAQVSQDAIKTKVGDYQEQIANVDRELSEVTKSLEHSVAVIGADTVRVNQGIEQRVAKRAELLAGIAGVSREGTVLQQRMSRTEEHYSKSFGEELTAASAHSKVTERQIARLEVELGVVQGLDPDVKEHAAELKEQLGRLESQLADLHSAASDIEALIRSLESDIHKHFVRSFDAINTQFVHFFARLFGGGKAQLSYEVADSGSFGIEISVTPPGKRPQALAVLSGGERALGGIALLAAIMAVNPSPFVVLDEVDAALDDTNAQKFTRILTDLQLRTQLIVITHNHETMQAARRLVGITSDERGAAMAISANFSTVSAQKD